jgi:hypothetical protein
MGFGGTAPLIKILNIAIRRRKTTAVACTRDEANNKREET